MKITNVSFLILSILFFVGCKGKTEKSNASEEVIEVTSLTIIENLKDIADQTPRMSGWKSEGLLGQVKTVLYNNGNFLEFNKDGNLVKSVFVYDGFGTQTTINEYESATKYKSGQDQFQKLYEILYLGDQRIEKVSFDNPENINTAYTFDKLGRVTRCEVNGIGTYAETYYYGSENEFFPTSAVIEESNETGVFVTDCKYSYVSIDSNYNWTERVVEQKLSITDTSENTTTESKTFTEVREITYFD